MSDDPAGVSATLDANLIERARQGDRLAQEELFKRHVGIAYRVAHRLLGHDQDAHDAVQDAFVKALRHLHDFDGRSGFRTWLLRIVTNAALDIGRARGRRGKILSLNDQDHSTDLVPGETDDPTRGLQSQDLRIQIDAALERLSPAIRTTFVLFAEAGLSYKEIAESQGVPVGTVMSRLHFARQKLQDYLKGIDF